MYCVKCGVELGAAESKCPLCNTIVYHPDFIVDSEKALYPVNKMPENKSLRNAMNGALIIIFLIPLFICFFSDLLYDGIFEWFGYVAGALVVSYVCFALPLWFKKPNPVIFTPCNFTVVSIYLFYINYVTDGDWYLSFVLPVISVLCLLTCAIVTLLHYINGGKLYIIGGAFIAFGALMPLIEFLLMKTFDFSFYGWSIYPLISMFLIGCMLIFLAINNTAREALERKLFF